MRHHYAQGLQAILKVENTGTINLSDYVQIAMQTQTSLLALNQARRQSEALHAWKIALANKLLADDLEKFRRYQKGKQALKAWATYFRERDGRVEKQAKLRQMQRFYRLFE